VLDEIIAAVSCDHCGVLQGQYCVTPAKGFLKRTVHEKRRSAARHAGVDVNKDIKLLASGFQSHM
jgi:hypothetical protein